MKIRSQNQVGSEPAFLQRIEAFDRSLTLPLAGEPAKTYKQEIIFQALDEQLNDVRYGNDSM